MATPAHRMRRLASRKGIVLRFPPLIVLAAACCAGTVVGATLASSHGALVGCLAGLLAPWLGLRIAPDRRAARIAAQVPGFVDAVARSLRSGRSLSSSVSIAASEAREPLAAELRPMLLRIDAGTGLRDSLAATDAATASAPLRTALAALAIANEAGGAQAMVLDALASSLRSRAVTGRELQAMATPVRMSATLIALAPPAVLGAVLLIDPTTASRAYASAAGRGAAVLGVVLDLAGLWWIRRLTRCTP